MTMIAGAAYAWLTLGLISGLFVVYFSLENASTIVCQCSVPTPRPHTGLSTRAWHAADRSTTSALLSLYKVGSDLWQLRRLCRRETPGAGAPGVELRFRAAGLDDARTAAACRQWMREVIKRERQKLLMPPEYACCAMATALAQLYCFFSRPGNTSADDRRQSLRLRPHRVALSKRQCAAAPSRHSRALARWCSGLAAGAHPPLHPARRAL